MKSYSTEDQRFVGPYPCDHAWVSNNTVKRFYISMIWGTMGVEGMRS